MTCDVYIGRLDDPTFSWDDGDWNGNAPVCQSPLFPPIPGVAYGAFLELRQRIETGVYNGKQVDWGAWVARVSKADILAFVDDLYATNDTYSEATDLPHLLPWLRELQDYVESLDPAETYALVATEL